MSVPRGEEPEIPAVCDSCLGPNPYLEMIRDRNGAECKLCTRPFTVFEWVPIKGDRVKRTIICLTCARSKNCCQVCMLDLTYGLDLLIRDSVLKLAGEEVDESYKVPTNALTKAYKADQLDMQYANGLIKNDAEEDKGNVSQRVKDLLLKVAKSQQQLGLNEHVKDLKNVENKSLSKDELQKLISKLPFNGNLLPKPEDLSLKSVFIFGITQELPEYSILAFFEKKYGTSVQSMSINHNAKVGYVVFKSTTTASQMAEAVLKEFLKLRKLKEYKRPVPIVIENVPLRVCWGKPKNFGFSNAEHYKIAQVVKKQMKVLADKDSKF